MAKIVGYNRGALLLKVFYSTFERAYSTFSEGEKSGRLENISPSMAAGHGIVVVPT